MVLKSKHSQFLPSIKGNIVAWQQYASNGKSNIYYKNLLTGTINMISQLKESSEPNISGKNIIWTQMTNSNQYSTYMKNIVTGIISKITK